jgi:hypothetical protein
MGKNFIKLTLEVVAINTIAGGVTMGFLPLNPVLYPAVGSPAPAYDCDDDTLAMYRHFEELGIESTPVVGNLELTGKTYLQCNHVWLLVGSGPNKIAYDWGTPRLDRQHYEGFKINLDYLLYVVQQDAKNPDLLPIAENR